MFKYTGTKKQLMDYGFVKVNHEYHTFVEDIKYFYSDCESEYDCITISERGALELGIDAEDGSYDKLYDMILDGVVEKISIHDFYKID